MTCEICGKRSFSNRCMAHKVRKPLNQIGKQGRKWISTKQRWLEQNKQPYYFCYLCGKMLTRSQLTLDHVLSRSRAPELRHKLSNLEACCWSCNSQKSSLSVEEFKKMKGKK